jgi:hypothetical protein
MREENFPPSVEKLFFEIWKNCTKKPPSRRGLWGIHQKAKVAEVSGEQHLGLTNMGSPVNHCTRFDAQMLSHLGRQHDLATALCITLKCEISA